MKNYRTAELSDITEMQKASFFNRFFANNYSAVNSFLYRNKYSSEILIENGWIFERFMRNGILSFSFPHQYDESNWKIDEVLSSLWKEADSFGSSLLLSNVTEEEKDIVLGVFPSAEAEKDRDSSDYIYLAEKLSSLSGSKLSRKRNHIHQFNKIYVNSRVEVLNFSNLDSVKKVEEIWLKEAISDETDRNFLSGLYDEKSMIFEALENFQVFSEKAGFSGVILYWENQPFAFSLFSRLSEEVTDIHFEKCLSTFAGNGGYAVINNETAKITGTKYINREEDLGIEGLRKAKLSYYPEIILPKYNLTVK